MTWYSQVKPGGREGEWALGWVWCWGTDGGSGVRAFETCSESWSKRVISWGQEAGVGVGCRVVSAEKWDGVGLLDTSC